MKNNTTLEEQKQVVRLLKHWHHVSSPKVYSIAVGAFAFVLIMVFSSISKFFGWRYSNMLFVQQVVMMLFAFALLAVWYARRNKFIHRLTKEEIYLLEQTKEIGGGKEQKEATILLTIYNNSKGIPNKELLRASQPTESGDTLLRAVAYTDDTLQEQLLRPTNEEPHP